MVKRVQVNMSNKLFYTLIVIGVAGLLGIGVYAYGTSNPSVMGHSVEEIAGLSSLLDNYYTKGEVNAMISAIETGGTGGTGCPVGYTLYEQSSEAAKCHKDGEVISTSIGPAGTMCPLAICEGRIVNGVLQTRATSDWVAWMGYADALVVGSWTDGASSVKQTYNICTVQCSINWKGVGGVSKGHPHWSSGGIYEMDEKNFGSVLRVQ